MKLLHSFLPMQNSFAVSQLFVSKTDPNRVKGFIRHRDFNSTTYKVTRHIVYAGSNHKSRRSAGVTIALVKDLGPPKSKDT